MKIRIQNALWILPLFLFVALVSSALMVKVEREEFLWGLREEVGSLAVATAEFIPGHLFRELVSDGTRTKGYGRLCLSLDRIVKQRQARRIFGLTWDGRQVAFSYPGPRAAGASQRQSVSHGSEPVRDAATG